MIPFQLYLELLTYIPRYNAKIMHKKGGVRMQFDTFRIEVDPDGDIIDYCCKHGKVMSFLPEIPKQSTGAYILTYIVRSSNTGWVRLHNPSKPAVYEFYSTANTDKNSEEVMEKLHSLDEIDANIFQQSLVRQHSTEYVLAQANASKLLPFFGNEAHIRMDSHLGSVAESLTEILNAIKEELNNV